MTPVCWLLALISLLLGALAGFLLGRSNGMRAAHGAGEAARGAERLEAERQLGAERSARAQAVTRAEALEQAHSLQSEELLRQRRLREDSQAALGVATAEASGLRTRIEALEAQCVRTEQRERAHAETATETADRLRHQLTEAHAERVRLAAELDAERAAGAERIETMRRADAERIELFAGARADMANSFEKLAASILEDKSKRFTDHNRVNIEQVLHPLREKLGEFQLKVEGLQADGLVGRTELKSQIEALRTMNEKLSADANNLVKALKGSSKQQGDWGELILIDMLKEAGLQDGKQFRVQASFTNEEGRQARPDVILNLPGEKHLVIDSKVSLTSYTEYCACDDDASRQGFLERHARSLQNHIDGLSLKRYQTLHQLQSIDFVVMFVPIEPAYLLALAHDGGLWQRAWNKNVLLVSPGTLFPVIRTIAHIWQQERQTRNVEEILKQAGGLYDKVATFAESFEDVGKRIGAANASYEKALNQLARGTGHVLGRISKLKQLGLRTAKKMPAGFQMDDDLEDEQDGGADANLPLLAAAAQKQEDSE
ncbi:DNA recombination protein RmuC [Acidipila sp. EB88]|uniref:DNA recombination protein RmuC n=1 Tax=Acidipila sp. EB88 TaxID=2305226 RepID=UPI000F5E3E1F|nr:DNA recombination protein RmuC [Acidipila sp. EB88]